MESMTDRVLIVDDDEGVATLCQRLLRRAGFEVQSAAHPREALRLLHESRFDLMLLDIRLPEMDGFTLLRLARERDPELAIVIVTGHGTVDTAVAALRHGAEGLVLKPFDSGKQLVQSACDALRKSRQAREAARLRALRPLFEVNQQLLAEVNPDRLRDLVVKLAQSQMEASGVALYVLEGDVLKLAAGRGMGDRQPQTAEVGAETGLLGRTVAWGLPLWVSVDMPTDPALLADLKTYHLSSALCVPLLRRGHPGGALLAGRAAGSPPFLEADLEVFTLLAGQVSAAMENAALYAELSANVQRLESSQQQLVRAEKLAALGRLTGSIAHEVNNPLQSIQNCLHLASRPELSEEKRRTYHRMAEEEVERLIQTVRQMLDFYRLSSADFVPTDVNALLDEVLGLADAPLADSHVQIKKLYRRSLPPAPVARNNLKQVFLNLILNARDAMPDGGSLELRTGLSRKGGSRVAEISFTDSGPGIAADELPRLFEPFYTTKERGIGLGLAVSYSIVEAHGGKISVDSTPNVGTTFRVLLPMERGPSANEQNDSPAPNSGS